ncbi:uncharacterized protein LOC110441235 [Mizuhopecten yessoensis]|uniref:uncharacterized protein LOC110441235 n=1 Tax=Mizuhopecten yessoensis TaxID=6573 RepID=UPI000B45F5D3|nr:uncharacterized protein LOC110441235 [Mizuhopecten yessoensis]
MDLTTDETPEYTKYVALFKGLKERYRHIRVVFTGREGAGKTTLCGRVKNEDVDIKLCKPTEGAVYHPAWFVIDWKSKEWVYNADQSPASVVTTRMGALVKTIETLEREAGLQAGSKDGSFGLPLSENPAADADKTYHESLEVNFASFEAKADGAFLSLWYMGGHTSFQASHNVFISSHGVYLLVFRLTDFLKDKLETDRLKKWIRLIGTFSSVELNSPKLKPHDPPLIFVGTFLDEFKRTTKDYAQLVKTIMSSIAKFPELSAHKFVRFCTADNSLGKDDTELKKLRGLITDAANHQDQWDRELPTRWLKLEMDLLKAREEGIRMLTLAMVIEVNKKSVAPLTDEEEMKMALEYLHCTRSVIYFREFDFIINDPQWLADFFSIFITDDQFLPTDDLLLTRDLELCTTKGELTHELIDGLLSLEKNQRFRPHKSNLLALMEKFGLIVRILMSGTTTENAQFSETYTIPSKLMELQNFDGITEKVSYLQQSNLFVSKTLCFVFKDVSVPDELFHRIFAKIMRTYKVASLSIQGLEEAAERDQATTDNTTCLYSGFGCFEVNDLCRVIVSMHAERSTIAVTVISLIEIELPADTGPRIRLKLEQILRDTLQMSNQLHFQYAHQLHCNFHLRPYDTPVQLYGIIHSERGVPCKGVECRGQHRLTKTDSTFWDIEQHLATVEGRENVAETTEGETNISNRRPTPRELGRLSRLVDASSCECLFIQLGLPYPEIQTTKWESQSLAGITLITKMFLKWTNIYPNQTFQDIQQAMTEAKMAAECISEVLETDEESQDQDMVPVDVWNRTPSDAEIEKIVTNVGSAFFNLCLELGLSPPIIEQHELGHPVNIQARMSALLRYWIDRFQTKATIGRLLTAMKVCRMDWHTTAQIWSP